MRIKACLTASSAALLLTVSGFVPVASAAEQEIETMVVTGSRIARDTFTTPAPVTVLTSEEMAAVGATNVGEFLSRIPQTVTAFNTSNNVFAAGSSGLQTQALRNLGSQRTLTLVNGKRFVSGQTPSVGYAVDLNQIPTSLVERIEIKTGGTSAIYGSDAIAGVINIILKDDFEGVEFTVQGSSPEDGDRSRYDLDLTLGSNFDRGNAWVHVGYSKDEGLSGLDRDISDRDLAYYTREALDAIGQPDIAAGENWLGSSFPPAGRMGDYLGDGTPFRSGLADQANSDRFNRASFRDIASPLERRQAAAGITYELMDNLTANILVNYSQTEIDTTYEPFPLDLNDSIWDIAKGGTGGMDVATGPMIPELLRTNLLADGVTNLNELGVNNTARRLTEFSGRGSDIDRRTIRFEGDVTYQFDNGFAAELWGTWGQTKADQQNNSGINAERAALALDVEVDPNDPTGNTLRCIDEDARQRGCAPFNVFGANTVSDAAVEYLSLNTQTDQKVEQAIIGLNLTGDMYFLPELPGGMIAFAAGVEYREEKGSETPDASVQAGVTTSNRILATDGQWDVTEGYMEVSVPVLTRLTLEGAYRYGDYSTVGGQDNWSLGFDAPVTDWARFRGTYSNAVRAPNVSDLFRGAGETFVNAQDICDGTTAASTGNAADNCRSVPAIADRIAADGVFALTQVEKQSTGGFNGGNPDANEETADTWTLGIVLTPTWEPLSNLQLAVDYYDIELSDVLTLPLRSDVVTNCYSVDPGAFDQDCPGSVPTGLQTLRNPNTGALLEINRSFLNQEDWTTKGVDIELSYSTDVADWWSSVGGVLSFNVLWNYLDEFEIKDNTTGSVNDEAGEILYPENRVYAGVTYTRDTWNLNWTVSWIDQAVDSNTPEETNENSGLLGEPLPDSANTCASRAYHTLSASYNPMEAIELFGGIRNLTDTDPCALTQFSKYGNTGTNTAAEMYDLTGRDYYIGFRTRF